MSSRHNSESESMPSSMFIVEDELRGVEAELVEAELGLFA